MPRDYPEYEDESPEETYRDPLKPFLIALVVLLLLFAAIIVFEEQAELPQETDLRRMRATWQRHCHRCHQHGGEHRDQGKGDTPTKGIGHPSAGRCARCSQVRSSWVLS